MSTNYYAHTPAAERLHVGKSAAGWVFALRIYPELGIYDLEDWIRLWSAPDVTLWDEYDRQVTAADMYATIANRNTHGPPLRRGVVDGRWCVRHGAGTWDLHTGDFT